MTDDTQLAELGRMLEQYAGNQKIMHSAKQRLEKMGLDLDFGFEAATFGAVDPEVLQETITELHSAIASNLKLKDGMQKAGVFLNLKKEDEEN